MKTILNIASITVFALFLAASCGNQNYTNYESSQLVGNWQEIMPEGNNFVKYILLEDNGSASSIGSISTIYNNWKIDNAKDGIQNIILQGISTENGEPVQFTDTLNIISIINDTLTIKKWKDYQIKYVKRENINITINDPDKLAKAILVTSTTINNPNIDGYIIFSPDSSSVELLLPEINVTLEKRTNGNGKSVWNIEDDDTYQVEKIEGDWQITRRGVLLYRSYLDDDIS